MSQRHLWIIAAASSVLLATPTAWADVIKDSQVQLKFRNFYLDRQYDNASTRDFGSWSQSVTLDAKSGYADLGKVKIGADLLAEYAVRLDGEDQRADWVLPYEGTTGSGKQARHFGKVGATLKAKVANTELKVGTILPATPVVHFDPSRQLLTTYNGVWLESKDIKNTKITLGYLDSINARYENQPMDLAKWPNNLNNTGRTGGMYVAGVDYQVNPEWSASYFYGRVKNAYQQNYIGIAHKTDLADKVKLNSHLRVFDNRETGDAVYGGLDNQALSIGTQLSYGAHTFGLGYQQMFGDHGTTAHPLTGSPYFPTLSGWVPQPYLVNWGVAGFIRKDEKSVGVTYGYNFKDVGLNGLTATAKYFKGWDVDSNYESSGAIQSKGKEDELNFILNYVVPEGQFKGFGLQWMYIDVDYKNITGQANDLKENRVAATYTYKF